jgi:acylglycerol lipase
MTGLILLLCLTACAPKRQVYHDAPEENAKFVADTFYAADDAPLPYRSWLPRGKPRAVIVAVHGFNDYSRAFIGTGTYFAKHGVAVYSYDQRGFGQSPFTGVWAGQQNLVHDLRECVMRLMDRYPNTPIYVLGESMGGAVAISALADPTFPKINGLILSAPAVWGNETLHPFYRATLWTAAHIFPYHEVTGSDLKILASNNYPMLRRMGWDPLVLKRTRLDSIYGLVLLMDNAYRHVPDIKTPTLLLYGDSDQVIPKQPIEGALERFTIPMHYAYYPGGYHMLLRDIQGEMVMGDILSWMERPAQPLPSGYGGALSPHQPE